MFGDVNASGLGGEVPQEGSSVGAAGWMGPAAHPTSGDSPEGGIPTCGERECLADQPQKDEIRF